MIQIWMLTKCRAEQQMKIKTCFFYPYPRSYVSEWGHIPINIRQQDHSEKGSMCCAVKCIQRRNQARVKNADLRHPSCTVVMQRRKSASPILNVLRASYTCYVQITERSFMDDGLLHFIIPCFCLLLSSPSNCFGLYQQAHRACEGVITASILTEWLCGWMREYK